jgi:molybdopterin converting factor small subunit
VTSHAGALVTGLPRETRLPQDSARTIAEVISRVEAVSGSEGVRAGVERYCAVLVNGTSIQHLAGWQTPVAPGDRVSIVAPMGGGS